MGHGRIAKQWYIVGEVAFVPQPGYAMGVWFRTHPCVTKVDCPMCGAKIGEPCISRHGAVWAAGTHHQRRHAAKGKDPAPPPGVIITIAATKSDA